MILVRLILGSLARLQSSRKERSRARRSGAGLWIYAAFFVALALTAIVLAIMGTGEKGMGIALRLTGRLSFLFFWPAYTGAAIAALFGPRFNILAQRAGDFGLAYASAHLVHVGLVAHLVSTSQPPITEAIMPFFAVGVVWTYLLALSSWERLSKLLSPNLWRALHNIGLEYLAIVFFADFVLLPVRVHIDHPYQHLPFQYLPFSILIIIGPILRIAAMIRRSGLLWSSKSSPVVSR